MRITKVKIQLEHSDGYYSNIETVMPDDVADQIASKFMTWEDDFIGTVTEIREYLDELEKVDWDEVNKKREQIKNDKNGTLR